MTFPNLPITPRTEVSVSSAFNPNIYQENDGYTERRAKDFRRVAGGSVSMSTYFDDLVIINNFLHERQGWKPFRFLQDNKLYIAKQWTITYQTSNRGEIQIEMIRYTNL